MRSNLITGEIHRVAAHAVVLATGTATATPISFLTNAKLSNATATWRAHRRGPHFANPSFVQIHPTCIPQSGEYQSKLTLASESLRNDGLRSGSPSQSRRPTDPTKSPKEERWYYLESGTPPMANLVPRDIALTGLPSGSVTWAMGSVPPDEPST